jgi:membrane protease YdiL (CAAX protease family)
MQLVVPIPVMLPFLIAGFAMQNPDLFKHPAVTAVGMLAGAVCVLLYYCRQTKTNLATLVGPLALRPGVYLGVALAVVGFLMIETPLATAALHYFPALDPDMDFGFAQSPLAAFTLIVLIAPWSEELVFRGIFLRGFVPRYGITKAVLTSAALFAAVHFYPVRLPGMFAAGILLCFLALRAGSLWPGILAHTLNNAIAATGMFFTGPGEKPGDLWPQLGPALSAAILLGGAALLTAGVFSIRRGTMETQ